MTGTNASSLPSAASNDPSLEPLLTNLKAILAQHKDYEYTLAKNIIDEIEKLNSKELIAHAAFIKKLLTALNDVFVNKNKFDDKAFKTLLREAPVQRSWGKIIGGALLALLGIALLAATITACVLYPGAATPLLFQLLTAGLLLFSSLGTPCGLIIGGNFIAEGIKTGVGKAACSFWYYQTFANRNVKDAGARAKRATYENALSY